MTLIKLTVTHKPSGVQEMYGPWVKSEDPQVALANISFAHGFLSGWFSQKLGEDYRIEDFDIAASEVDEGPKDEGPTVVGQIVAEASASVTHADGSVS